MNPTRFLAFFLLPGMFLLPPLTGTASAAGQPTAAATKPDEDALDRIKRTNTQAPDRPAAQQAAATAAGKNCQVLFLGDSNTHFWENGDAKVIWDHYYKDRQALNFGIGGDTINDIRSRLRDTKWGDCQPPVTVVLAGTNDRGDKPERRAHKIRLLLDEILAHFPQTHVLLLSIPPCGLEERSALTASYFATNDLIKTFADGKRIFYIDLAQTMTWEEGLGFAGLGGDRLHLNQLARLRWAELMEPLIAKTLSEKPREPLPHPKLPEYTGDPKAPKILIAGDGLAANGDFRIALQNQLREHGFKYHLVGPYADPKTPPEVQALHFADWGAVLDTLQTTIPPVTKKYAPDVLVLFAGFGELNYGRNLPKNVDETVVPRVGKILDDVHVRSPATQIILCLITPHSAPEKNAVVRAANLRILDLLKNRAAAGQPVLYADCYSAVDTPMLSQGYAFTKPGLLRAAASVAPSLEAVLNQSIASRPLSAPTKVTAAPDKTGTQLAWPAVPQATRYNVKRSMKAGGPYALIATGLTDTHYTDSNFRPDADYYYVVSAADAQGQGPDSPEIKVPASPPSSGTP